MNYIRSQFAHPRGFVGQFTGKLMARMNLELNQWTISLLDIQADDHVLEIGFGPGEAIHQVSAMANNGFVAGIDISKTMLDQAQKRNAAAIQNGQVKLMNGSVSQLPFEDKSFDKVFAVNSIQEWPHLHENLQEVYRVLKPEGIAALTVQPRWIKTNQEALSFGEQTVLNLVEAGFHNVQLQQNKMEPILAICAVGAKQKSYING